MRLNHGDAIMNSLRFALLVMLSVVFGSCPAESGFTEITYENQSQYIVSKMFLDTTDDNSFILRPGETTTFPYLLPPPYIDSLAFEFSYTLNGKEFSCPDKETGRPKMLIHLNERKTVVIYSEYYEIR
jgi:hypothetical protein